MPRLTTSGTRRLAAPSMWRFTSSLALPCSGSGTSKTSSSCTCSTIRVRRPSARSAAAMRIIASLIRSAAEPCSGELVAVRSPKARMLKFLSCSSGI